MAIGEKAKIIILGNNDREEDSIQVMFNPEKYRINYSTDYNDIPVSGTDLVVTQFQNGNPSTLCLELLFDTSSKEYTDETIQSSDVMEEVDKIISLIYVKSSLHCPSHVKFVWGSLNYLGIVTKVDTSLTEFERSGKPVRATVDLEIKEYIDITKASRKTPFESPDRTKIRQITEGKNLWHIAYEEYGDMSMWKVIAAENNTVNPFDIMTGQYLKIPALK